MSPILTTGAGKFPAAAGGGSPSRTTTDSKIGVAGFTGTSGTLFNGMAVNNSSTSDIIVVRISNKSSNTNTITGVTIGGDAMTQAAQSTASSGCSAAIFYITGHIYTTPNIVVTGSLSIDRIGITVDVLTNITTNPGGANTTATQTYGFSADPQVPSAAVTVPATGYYLVVQGSESPGTPVWSNGAGSSAVSDAALTNAAGWDHNSAHNSTTGSLTPSITGYNFAGSCMAVAVWGP